MNYMDKILTVVIPTYNMEKYLRKCLDSLIIEDKELFNTLEVLVVNDGSKDSSSAIAHEYQDKFPNVFRVVDKENGNYGSCVNRGLREATGKYIKILDADDSYDNNNLSKFLELLCQIDVDLILSNYLVVNGHGKVRRLVKYDVPSCVDLSFPEYIKDIKGIEMHSVTYKCANIRNIHYVQTEGVSYTDLEWVFSPLVTVKTFYYFNSVIYRYLVGREGQTVELSTYHKRFYDRMKGVWSMINSYKDICGRSDLNASYTDYLEKCLIGRLEGIYLSCLVVNRNATPIVEMDMRIKNEIDYVYNKLNDSIVNKLIKYKYIRYWRLTQSLPPLYVSYIHKLIKKLQFFLKAFI